MGTEKTNNKMEGIETRNCEPPVPNKNMGFQSYSSHPHHLSSHMKLRYRKEILNKISQPSWSIWGIANMLISG